MEKNAAAGLPTVKRRKTDDGTLCAPSPDRQATTTSIPTATPPKTPSPTLIPNTQTIKTIANPRSAGVLADAMIDSSSPLSSSPSL